VITANDAWHTVIGRKQYFIVVAALKCILAHKRASFFVSMFCTDNGDRLYGNVKKEVLVTGLLLVS
jgi:hypothetical protein